MATFRPGTFKRRLQELGSGYAFTTLAAVKEELDNPKLATEKELARLRNPQPFISPLVSSSVSAVGIFYLARIVGINRYDHIALSGRSRVFGVAVALPYFATMACLSSYCWYSDMLEQLMRVDSAFVCHLRRLGEAKAPSDTAQVLATMCGESRSSASAA
eukprot:TRINITY_DN26650_c0_g1_i1.p1 TRINITY_DN26650_c0_g1~~TRINITY_DN26650_c0_g1_i1.p1  ORF type:complete len:160 (+),score=20.13 TRINITY_DN26650_c0_g1_i1:149-628(+)